MKRGVELFRKQGRPYERVDHVYDVKHKSALFLKAELESDPRWSAYVTETHRAKLALTQTCLAFLTPPGLKTKARYMNLDTLVSWGQRVLTYLDDPCDVPDQKVDRRVLKTKLGWLRRYRQRLSEWSELLAVTEATENYVRHEGFHAEATDELRGRLDGLTTCSRSRRMKERLLTFISEQSSLASGEERLIGSSEVIESVIGKYKRLQSTHSKGGMTAMLLSIGAIVSSKTTATIRQAMEKVTTSDVWKWCRDHLGTTLQAQRTIALNGNKNGIHSTTRGP